VLLGLGLAGLGYAARRSKIVGKSL
jgi:hypothetical protein